MDAINFNFLCNDFRGLQTSKKCLKLFNYFKNKIFPNGILFLQKMHSTKDNKVKWKDKFDIYLYFSHRKSNLCGVVISFSGNKTFTVKKCLYDENGWILILETLTDDSEFILINFYNANTESEQIQTLNELNMLLSHSDLGSKKHIFCWWL